MSAQSNPNVILIYADDQGYGDVSAMNPDAKFQTKNIDRLAHEGIMFTDGHCCSTVCTPSRYGLLTGRYSWRTTLKKGVMGSEGKCLIENGRMTLASLFRKHNYNTAMIGKWHLGMQFAGEKGNRNWNHPVKDGPVEKGFDYFYGLPASMNFGILSYIENDRLTEHPVLYTAKKKNEYEIDDYRIMPPYEENYDIYQFDYVSEQALEVAPDFYDAETLTRLTDKSIEWLDSVKCQARAEKPFFLYLSYTAPHKPVCPRGDYVGKSEIGGYGDFMLELDDHIGRILQFIDDQQLEKNTMIIFTSDNGPETTYVQRRELFGHDSAGGWKGGKRDIYEGGHRVPFIIRWPSVIKPGQKCAEPVCQTDFLATFADLLGEQLQDHEGEDSFNLSKVFMSDGFVQPLRGPIIHHSGQGYFAIREGKWKLNMISGSGGSLAPEFQKLEQGELPYELYDMEGDPGETRNVCSKYPEVVKRLEDAITEVVREGRSTPGKRQNNDGAAWWPQLTWMLENTVGD